ncbi:MAG: hypothetical protein PHX70_02025 [Clostridium sp.]|nr:hypothetical protein [Clostridium sp.]
MITFLLLLIGILLVVLNLRAIKDNSFDKKMKEAKENTGDFELKLGEMRKEFAETVLELQKDIEELKDDKKFANNIKSIHINDEYKDKGIYNENSEEINKDEHNEDNKKDNKKEDSKRPVNGAQIKEIEKLLKKGLSEDDISQKLGIGKGEILLIKDLYLK